MALQDIIDAIIAETDARIQSEQEAHKARMKDWRDQSKSNLEDRKKDLDTQCEEKKKQMKAKTATLITVEKRNALLRKKRELLDTFYHDVTKELAGLSPKELESIFSACLKKISTKGTIHPAKKHEDILKKLVKGDLKLGDSIDASGGFIFRSDKQESNFTFENLVQNTLRPKTELDTAATLFNS